MAGINDNALKMIEDHRNLVTLHDNAQKSPPVITQTQITKNIDLVWQIVNDHQEAIRGTNGVPVLWCVCDTVFPKYHRVDLALDHISIDEELVVICPMILASYVGPCDEATADDIYVCDYTAIYCTDNKIVFCYLSHIFRGGALWAHTKCAVKTRNKRLAYKWIYNHLFGENALVNRNAMCETTIGYLEYHGEEKSFNWQKYTNIYVEQYNIKSTMTDNIFNDWSYAHKV